MKPITGEEVSSKPVSLSTAATVLSKFLDTDTGGDDEMLAFLHRASMAFDELVNFHREMDSRRGSSEKVDAGDYNNNKNRGGYQIKGGERNDKFCSETKREDSGRVDIEMKNEKKKRKKMAMVETAVLEGGVSVEKVRCGKQIPVVKTCAEEDREVIGGFHAEVKKKKKSEILDGFCGGEDEYQKKKKKKKQQKKIKGEV